MRAHTARPLAVLVLAAAAVVGSCTIGAKSPAPEAASGDGKPPATAAVAETAKAGAAPPAAAEPMPAHGDGEKKAEEKPAAKAAPEPNDCISAKCHTTILAKKNVHDAAEGCTDCHSETATPHPQKGKKTFELINTVPDLCYTCHDEFGKKKTVHSPVEDGSCTECHDPHSTAEEHLLKKPVGEVCKDCHDDPTSHPKLHSPVEDGSCTDCHDPHETDTKSLLVKEVPDLCLDCHESMADALKQKVVHGPVGDGDCLACHDPHGAKLDALLAEEPKALCLSCHGSIADEIKEAKVSHDPMDDDNACLSCHSPHASDNESLLEKPVRATCLECHDANVPADAKVLHGKNHDGRCVDCHTPHGGEREYLLAAEFPEGIYQKYDGKQYALCFKCHERSMVEQAETSTATGFRDGKKNLHFVHVDKADKSRSCVVCHSVHGTDNPKLIQDSLEFGKWQMQLKFVKTDTGGGCSPGCHRPLYYDRDSPGRKPPGTKTAVDKGA